MVAVIAAFLALDDDGAATIALCLARHRGLIAAVLLTISLTDPDGPA
jgi:hypothetical protein